jgi:Family of unknown function (DUF6079)
MDIKHLFDPSKDIYRTIEKVITYGAAHTHRLKAEIAEYEVTKSIEEQLERLLSSMQAAMELGGENEVGVWVSGFYGSGKSSFTKYLGLALDNTVQIDGIPFLRHLQDRLQKPQTRALLSTVAQRFPAAVLLLDLASEQVAGATMEEVSTVLYYKVLQWAGYSRNLKVAAFERRLKKDGRSAEFHDLFRTQTGEEWHNYQNDELVVDSLLPALAHQMYPMLFTTPTAFTTATSDFIYLLDDRVQEMMDIIRDATGKDYILFVIDELGQYVGGRQHLILNLQGLAQNLKRLGDGKVWLIGTAQQTLTEDDPRAALNSPELYKLKDRFPVQIDLEPGDIKEICYRRLLGKSPAGATALSTQFDLYGQVLRHHTRLQDAKYYDADFTNETFINLYPFLPAHFDILLHLLGALAKSTGGIGLRSAIKVFQDILVEGTDGDMPVADQPVGYLATTVTLYDALEKDIRRAFPSTHRAVGKVQLRFPDTTLHRAVAKTVAVLQILDNLPVTLQNVASLLHPLIDAPSQFDAVKAAAEALIADPYAPFGEQEGQLRLFSEKLNDIEQERAQIPPRAVETRRILYDALKEAFAPLPATQIQGNLSVQTGLKVQSSGGTATALAGERNTIQTVVELVEAQDYETVRTRLVDDSRHQSARHVIFLLGRSTPALETLVADIYRCQEIVQRYRNEPDQEIRDYSRGQSDRAERLIKDQLQPQLKRSLSQGSFIFRGHTTAVSSLAPDVVEAGKKYLAGVAQQVFERYPEAPVRAETALAEKFLRVGNLTAVTSAIDPLGLVQVNGGRPSIYTAHKALGSIRDYIDRMGTVEGKRLTEHFTEAPFGWSPDTLRYLVGAMLVASEITLKVSGREVTVNGQLAIDALKTNNSFRSVGVALRAERPALDVLARAAERLTDLIGEAIVPLEDEISKATIKYFPQFQYQLAPLAEKFAALGLPGDERLRELNQTLAEVLFTDASDAPQRLGGAESVLYNSLKWAVAVKRALANGLEQTLRQLQQYQSRITALPDSGIPGQLKTTVAEELTQLHERLAQTDFYTHAADFNTLLTSFDTRVHTTVLQMEEVQQHRVQEAAQELTQVPEWGELTQEEHTSVLADLETLTLSATPDLQGLQALLNQELVIHDRVHALKNRMVRQGQERRRQRLEDEKARAQQEGRTKLSRAVAIPTSITDASQLDVLIQTLQALRHELALYSEIEVRLHIQD